MDTAEASELWGLSQPHIKLLCTKGEVICRKIGRVWFLKKTSQIRESMNHI
ncbi:hypothetical protein [Lysinibacillus fusiformis]|uniref:hypothetical protein n=1 Tax=Lysinibacillus fusiformis TaxID=28031 RepID=UPI003B971455